MELIPAIDLLGGRVVRLAQGDYDRVTVYSDDPVAMAHRWVAEGATRLHLVDLDGAKAGRPVQAPVIAAIVAAAGVPCQVAGGLRDAAAVAEALGTGAERAILGSALVRDPGLGRALVERHGPDAIVAAIDVRDGRALGDGWVPGATGTPALELIATLAANGVRWFAVTAIARDGLLEGPDLGLLAAAQAAAPGANVIASAGVSSVADIRALDAGGYAGAILGRALYEGRISLPEALERGA
ncbi:MAG: 1-(5-phosphoribosyl)-5-[(5-phosphoribosylamino)methylideneamino] imidazole-4-carboxamide isomerase [Chloroflexota bacterium]